MRCWLIALVVCAACQTKSSSNNTQPPHSNPSVKDAAGATPPADADFAKTTGKETYVALCAPCHGADLKGYAADHAPSLANPTFLESATDMFLKRSIAMGRPGTSMAAYSKAMSGPLDDAAIDRLVGFIREQTPTPLLSLPVIAAGDPIRGQKLFDDNCKTCHGDRASRGEAVHLANPQFLQTATDPFLRHAIVKGRPGTKMLAFAPAMPDQDIDAVVSYIRSFQVGAPEQVQPLPPPTGKEPLVINPKGGEPQWNLREDRFVSVDDVASQLKVGKRMVIIDARPAPDWMRVHIAGAVSIPYHELKRLDELPKDVYAIAYCACPHHLSGIVVDELRKRGYKKSLVLDEGINVWHQRGYPVVAAKGVQPPPPTTPMPTPHDHPH